MSETKQPVALLYAALAKAQGKYRRAAKNRTASEVDQESGELNTWQYADLDEILWAVRDALSENGLAFFQRIAPVQGSNALQLITEIGHEGGGVISSVVPLASPDAFIDIKQFGAQLTFLRRYMAEPLLGITSYYEEPDGGAPTHSQIIARLRSGGASAASVDRFAQALIRGQEQYPEANASTADSMSCYSQEAFDASIEEWKQGVAKGITTPERLIDVIESTAPLTDAQRQTILAIEVPQS